MGSGRVAGEVVREGGRETQEAKILHEVKVSGACWCSENNRKLVTVVWSADLAHFTNAVSSYRQQ